MDDHLKRLLATPDAAVTAQWAQLEQWFGERFGRDTSIEAMLFMIGVQSQGQGFEPDLDKERKQALIMEGTYCAFETLGFYQRAGMDTDGLWLWERLVPVPSLPLEQQEKLLQVAILRYFDTLFAENTPS